MSNEPTPEQLKAKIAQLRDDGLYETAGMLEALQRQLAEAREQKRIADNAAVEAIEEKTTAEAAAASARDKALEEAALVCEQRMTCGCGRDDCYSDRIPEDLAERIRALKSSAVTPRTDCSPNCLCNTPVTPEAAKDGG